MKNILKTGLLALLCCGVMNSNLSATVFEFLKIVGGNAALVWLMNKKAVPTSSSPAIDTITWYTAAAGLNTVGKTCFSSGHRYDISASDLVPHVALPVIFNALRCLKQYGTLKTSTALLDTLFGTLVTSFGSGLFTNSIVNPIMETVYNPLKETLFSTLFSKKKTKRDSETQEGNSGTQE